MFHTTPHIHLTRHAGVWRDVLFRLFPIVSLLFAFASPAYGGHGAAWSSDGETVALTVPYGAPKALMTSVWTMRPDGSDPKRIGLFLGEPGSLEFVPGSRKLVYIERGLSYVGFGSTLSGGSLRRLPLVKNRVWRLDADGLDVALWKLSGDINPLEIAVSGDGDRLAVVDEGGLWVVDQAGVARVILEDQVAGPIRWCDGEKQIACLVNGNETVIPVDGSSNGELPDTVKKKLRRDIPPGWVSEASSDWEEAVRLIRQSLNWWARGHHAMHRGEYRSARQGLREAVNGFKTIRKRYVRKGLSEESCQAYIDAIRSLIVNDESFEEAVCKEHMIVLGDLMVQYRMNGEARATPDLERLETWVKSKINSGHTDQVESQLSVLKRLTECPATDLKHMPENRYVSKLDAPSGVQVLTCFWHRGRRLDLIRSPGGFTLESSAIKSLELDSLFSIAAQCLSGDHPEQAIFPLRVLTRQRPEEKDSYIAIGHSFLRSKDYKGAKWAFKKAVSMTRKDPEPYYGLGLVHMEFHNERYQAISYFQRALIRDQKFVDARYQIAFARYILNEHDVKPELERVLEMDPEYAEAYMLMGDWYANFWDDYEQAIVWYTRYVAMRPTDKEGSRKLGYAYLKVKDYDRILGKLRGFVQEFPQAIELMPIVAQACVKREKFDMAMGFFSTYVSRLDSLEQSYYLDIGLIASAEEMQDLEALSGDDQAALIEMFWNKRDPDITTSINERLLEHYRRVWFARTEYSKGKEPWDRRGEVYIRFGEPNHASTSNSLNVSQNLAVLQVKERLATNLYGTDAVGETFAGPVFPIRNFSLERDILGFETSTVDLSIEAERDADTGTDDVDSDLRQLTLSGPSRDGSTSTERGGTGGTGAGQTVGEGGDLSASEEVEYTGGFLESQINTEIFSGSGFGPVLSSSAQMSSIPWESWVYLDVDGGIEITFTDEFSSGIFDFAPVPSAPDLQVSQMSKFWRFSPAKLFEQAVALSPDYYVPDYEAKPFDFYYTLADFRGRNKTSALEIYFGIPCLPYSYEPKENITRLAVTRQLALLSTTSEKVYRRTGDIMYQRPGNQTGPGAVLPDLERLDVPPGVYRLEVKVRDRLSGRLGLYRQQVVVEDYHKDRLRVSDLELAHQIAESKEGGQFAKRGLNVVPMPSRTYHSGQNVFVFYEIYNLKKDDFGQTNYRVQYTMGPKAGGVLAKLVHTLTGKKRKEGVAIGYDQLGYGELEVAYTELDLGEARSGRHYLNVKVTDLVNGNSFSKETTFVVAK
jgi:GWxTD domain-containing protein